jgi:hypothetical protein
MAKKKNGTSLKQKVYKQLRHDIVFGSVSCPVNISGKLGLTAKFQCSRGPVREAFNQLKSEGFIDLLPNQGAIVRRTSPKGYRRFLRHARTPGSPGGGVGDPPPGGGRHRATWSPSTTPSNNCRWRRTTASSPGVPPTWSFTGFSGKNAATVRSTASSKTSAFALRGTATCLCWSPHTMNTYWTMRKLLKR